MHVIRYRRSPSSIFRDSGLEFNCLLSGVVRAVVFVLLFGNNRHQFRVMYSMCLCERIHKRVGNIDETRFTLV